MRVLPITKISVNVYKERINVWVHKNEGSSLLQTGVGQSVVGGTITAPKDIGKSV